MLRNCGKMLEKFGKNAKCWESFIIFWKCLKKFGFVWKMFGNVGKCLEIYLKKIGKICEKNRKMLGNVRKILGKFHSEKFTVFTVTPRGPREFRDELLPEWSQNFPKISKNFQKFSKIFKNFPNFSKIF